MTTPMALAKTMLVVNSFVCQTVDMLNLFARICDDKLYRLSLAINRTSISVALLETKLRSIDQVSNDKGSVETLPLNIPPLDKVHSRKPIREPVKSTCTSEIPEKYLKLLKMGMPTEHVRLKMSAEGVNVKIMKSELASAAALSVDSITERPKVDPQLAPYLRMINIGVPLASVKHKMTLEGVDSSLLDR